MTREEIDKQQQDQFDAFFSSSGLILRCNVQALCIQVVIEEDRLSILYACAKHIS